MNQNARRQRHEQARKKHKHEQQQLARQAKKQGRSKTPRWLLIGGVVVILVFVLTVAFGR
jgi:type VI protein secretion system component VasF